MSRIRPRSEAHRAEVIAQKEEALFKLGQVMRDYHPVLNGELSGQGLFESILWLRHEIDHLSGESYLAQIQKLCRK